MSGKHGGRADRRNPRGEHHRQPPSDGRHRRHRGSPPEQQMHVGGRVQAVERARRCRRREQRGGDDAGRVRDAGRHGARRDQTARGRPRHRWPVPVGPDTDSGRAARGPRRCRGRHRTSSAARRPRARAETLRAMRPAGRPARGAASAGTPATPRTGPTWRPPALFAIRRASPPQSGRTDPRTGR